MNILTLIPAREGSKRILNKNLALLGGKPLLVYTIEAALAAGVSENVYVSTDSELIAQVAEKSGAKIIMRPADIATDTSSIESAIIHACNVVESASNVKIDLVLTLSPTSPLRTAHTIREFVSYFDKVKARYDALFSLTESRADYWLRGKEGEFIRLFPHAPRRSQERQPLFIENSALYITKKKALIENGSILGKKCAGFLLSTIESLDINEIGDLQIAEFILAGRLIK